MIVNGYKFDVKEVFDSPITVPDCFVLNANKLGRGNGEAKLYISSKNAMREFFGNMPTVTCFILKQDLITYLQTLKGEYMHPSQPYRKHSIFPELWRERIREVEALDEIIYFNVADQTQIEGPRGYVNSEDLGYKLIRELSLPLVSYIQMMMVADKKGKLYCYWKLFVDFNMLYEKNANGPWVFNYGKGKQAPPTTPARTERETTKTGRVGQDKYRAALLLECPYCPITMVNDERLLVASHIKPWAVASDKEKLDPKNGLMLTPIYDALFDKGFITFTDDKRMVVSEFLSPANVRRLGLKQGQYYANLPFDEKRLDYMTFHRQAVFKGAGTSFE